MEHILHRLWHMPDRLPPARARLLIGLAAVAVALAGLGVVAYDGWERVIYLTMFAAIALSNAAWGAGSLLPEARGGRAARVATMPLGIVVLAAIVAWLAFQVVGRL